MSEEQALQRALELASQAIEDGGGPFAACLIKSGAVLALCRNRTVADGDPTQHAEIVAIREACQRWGQGALAESTAACSCEPCPMCLVALYYSGVRRIVYAAALEDARRFGSGDPPIHSAWLNATGNLELELEQLGNHSEAVSIFQRFVDKYGHL